MIEVQRGGVMMTVQDAGRFGWRQYGVPWSGAADADALFTANLLVGNPGNTAAVELTLSGAALRFKTDLVMALMGADLSACLVRGDQQEAAPLGRPLLVRAGTSLQTGAARAGVRLYLAVTGGIQVPAVLGSASTYVTAGLGGVEGRALCRGDHLKAEPDQALTALPGWHPSARQTHALQSWGLDASSWPAPERPLTVRAMEGPEAASFTVAEQQAFWTQPFRVSPHSNRMGVRLSALECTPRPAGEELLSSAVCPGTVQVPPSGEPIVLLADAQTVGGYPRLAQVAQVDLPRLAQLAPGDEVRFTQIQPQEARALYLERDRDRRALQSAVRLRWAGGHA